jgi:two-component system phosphate regulon sensor histidine kinase PhoR
MILPRWYFPWRVARRYFAVHAAFVLFVLALSYWAIRLQIRTELNPDSEAIAIGMIEGRVQTVLLLVSLASLAFLVFMTRRQVRPLGRLIQLARRLRKVEEPEVGDEAFEDEVGEWGDLERALLRLHGDLSAEKLRQRSEREELVAVVGAVPDAILSIDRAGAVRFFNSQFALLFGQEQNQGRDLHEVLRQPEILEAFSLVLKTGLPRQVQTVLRTDHHQGPRTFSVSLAPLRRDSVDDVTAEGDRNAVDGAVAVFHDISEIKATEQIRIDFVANASHELRTPLTSMKGYVEALHDDLKRGRLDEAPTFLQTIQRSVDRMSALVADLLDLSVIESGAEIKKSIVSTRDVTESALRALEPKRREKRQEIRLLYQTDSVWADARRLEQVVTNLVDNAIKYVPDGRKIEVFWEREGRVSLLRVRDNGPGIPQEHLARLFERFYRVDAGRSREQGGTGLGLAIVKHIMIKHGGSVRVLSSVGEGCEFLCSFPDR